MHYLKVAAMAALASVTMSATSLAQPLTSIPHQVLTFYYGWYTTAFGLNWVANARWSPAGGSYNSDDPAVIVRQLDQMKQAGITGLIVSWWPPAATFEDRQLAQLLPLAAARGLKVTVLIEDIDTISGPGTPESTIAQLRYILASYASSPAWLSINGRPVMFVYDRAMLRLPSVATWNGILDALRASFPGAIVLATGQSNPANNPASQASFDGLFDYGITTLVSDEPLTTVEAWLRKADQSLVGSTAAGQIACVTVGAGYDDTRTLRPPPRPILERFDGATYRAAWRAALASGPDWVLISTFNEWIEGTQIEPSVQFGTIALDDTLGFSQQLLASAVRKTTAHATTVAKHLVGAVGFEPTTR